MEGAIGLVTKAKRHENGAIFGRTERAVLDMVLPPRQATTETNPRPIQPDAAARRRLVGVYASYPDTLRIVERGDSLVYWYGGVVLSVRADASDPNAVLIVTAGGDVEQQFMLVRGRDGRTEYLHDGLNAFRRISRSTR